jgi:glycerophosphoryl diester phosphodiesterase
MLIPFCALLVFLVIGNFALRASGQRIIAHRGASIDAPENTLGAFRLAWEQGADGIEGDYHLSADGKVVCIHDDNTKRIAGIEKLVKATNYADLEKLDIGSWMGTAWRGERIALLDDVLAMVPKDKLVFVEFKSGPEIVEPAVKVLEESSLAKDQIVIISFNAEVIAACKQKMPEIKCHLLTDYKQQDDGTWKPSVDEVIASLRRARADGLGSEARPEVVNRQFIDRLRAAGFGEFHVWTVNDAATARFYQQLGAWAITTDCPGKLRAELAE